MSTSAEEITLLPPLNRLVTDIYNQLYECIKTKSVSVESPLSIVTKGMELLEKVAYLSGSQKTELLLQVLSLLARGPDGTQGTKDDIIPFATLDILQDLAKGPLLQDFATIIIDASKGKFNLAKTVEVASSETVKAGCCMLFSLISKAPAASKAPKAPVASKAPKAPVASKAPKAPVASKAPKKK